MKKLFFAICFNICLLGIANAKITPISGYTNITQQIVGNKEDAIKEVDREEFAEFLDKRFKSAKKASKKEINKTTSHIGNEIEQLKKEDDGGKNFFREIYERAIKNIKKPAITHRDDVAIEEDLKAMVRSESSDKLNEQTQQWRNPLVPMVTTFLPPYNIPTEVPAIEHIPYLMNNIEILPTGMIMFEETIVVVANGQKLKSGLTKILPSTISDRKRKSQHIDYTIIKPAPDYDAGLSS